MTTYVNSVQEITLSLSSQTSNTATVSAPTGTYYIASVTYKSSSTSDPATGLCRVELTNSTTITATLNTSGSVTCKIMLVDATSSLVNSVQSGTVAIGNSATSGTATISAVTNANAHVLFLGATSQSALANYGPTECLVTLSGTTVTAKRTSASSSVSTVGFMVIEYQGAALNSSTQQVTTTLTSGTSTTSTISSVTLNNAAFFWGGRNCASSSTAAHDFLRCALTSATQLTASCNTTSTDSRSASGTVVEFIAAVLNSAVQRGNITLSSQTSNTGTISSVNTSYAVCNNNGYTSGDTSSGDISREYHSLDLTSATVVTLAIQITSSGTGYFEIIEFSFSSGTTLTIDFPSAFETLLSLQSNPPIKQEWLANLTRDTTPPLELLAGAVIDRTAFNELLATQRADRIVGQEWIGTLRANAATPDETTAILKIDSLPPLEALTGQSRDVLTEMDLLASAVAHQASPLEWTGSISLTFDAVAPLEWQANTVRDTILPAEALSGFLVSHRGAVEYLLKVTADMDSGLEFQASSRSDLSGAFETSALMRLDVTIPAEGLLAVHAEILSPAESLGSASGPALSPAEWLGSFSRDASAPLEALQALVTQGTLPAEILSNVVVLTLDATLPLEWLASVTADRTVAAEYLLSSSRDTGLPIEQAGTLRIDAAILSEWVRRIIPPPAAGRIIVAQGENRTLGAAQEARTIIARDEYRIVAASGEVRVIKVNKENRKT